MVPPAAFHCESVGCSVSPLSSGECLNFVKEDSARAFSYAVRPLIENFVYEKGPK